MTFPGIRTLRLQQVHGPVRDIRRPLGI